MADALRQEVDAKTRRVPASSFGFYSLDPMQPNAVTSVTDLANFIQQEAAALATLATPADSDIVTAEDPASDVGAEKSTGSALANEPGAAVADALSGGSSSNGITERGYKLRHPGYRRSDYVYDSQDVYAINAHCEGGSCYARSQVRLSLHEYVVGGSSQELADHLECCSLLRYNGLQPVLRI